MFGKHLHTRGNLVVPRQLQELPRLQYCYRLDTPKWDGDKPKSPRVQHIGKHGEITYKSQRRKGNRLKYKNDVVRPEVWCTICFDAGCDKCPPYTKDEA